MHESRRLFLYLARIWHAVFAPLVCAALLAGVLFAREQLSLVTTVICIVAGFAIVASLACSWLASRRLSEAHDALRRALQDVARGDFASRVDPEARPLIEPLAEEFDRTRGPLAERFAVLQASTDQLRTVLNSMVEGVIAVDDAQRVLLLNDSACRMFRLHEAVIKGRPLWEQVRNHKLTDAVTQAMNEGQSAGVEIELLTGPAPRILQVRAAPLPSAERPGAIVVASDVTELRRLEKIRQQFVSNASHELKTPLASIKLCLETLLDGALDDTENALAFLRTAHGQAERLDQLVRDMLALTRIESEQVPLQIRPVPIHEVIERCLDRHKQHAERKSLAVRVNEPVDCVLVQADEEALQQILDNLLDNAIKYTNPGGAVTIEWTAEGPLCRLTVEDTGIGIPQSQLPRIFERFYRVDAARSRELGGTGLGLSIVKHLVQALKGTIKVDSQIGRGSKFTICLPASQAVPDTDEEEVIAAAS